MNKKMNRPYKWQGSKLLAITLMVLVPALSMAQDQSFSELIQSARDAGIEQSRLADLQSRTAGNGITDQQLAGIIGPAIALAEQNLPSEMIFQKAMEGIAKGIPTERLQPVLQNLQRSTISTVAIVDPWVARSDVAQMMRRSGEQVGNQAFRNELLKAGSKAMAGNVSPESLQGLFEAIGQEITLSRSKPSGIVAAVNIFPDLPSTARQPEASGAAIAKALQSGFEAGDMQKLPGAMNAAQRRSQLPAAAVIEGIAGQMVQGTLAAQILQNLFNGNIGGGPPGSSTPGLGDRPGQGGPGGYGVP
ncbi:MAG: hypothetical protein WD266_01300 [Balneolales bacterium]